MSSFVYKVLALLCFWCAVSPAQQIGVVPTERSGWLGADVAYTRLRSDAERIWLFGDTFIGDLEGKKRINGRIVNNSVAIERNGEFSYFWGTSERGVFVNQRKGEWYWPADLVVIDSKLFVFLRRVKRTSKDDPFGFRLVGNDLAIVSNFLDSPESWKIEINPLGYDELALGAAASVRGQYLFMLADDKSHSHGLLLTRMLLERISSTQPLVEFYDPAEGSWGTEISQNPVIKHGASEASLSYVSSRKRWRVVLSPKGMSPDVVFYESEDLTKTWNGPVPIHTCPEAAANAKYYCYAAKEIDTNGEDLLFTYSVNSFDFWDLSRDPSIYIPRVMKSEIK